MKLWWPKPTLRSLFQILPLMLAPDNVFVDPANGHLWVTILSRPLVTAKYLAKDRRLVTEKQWHHVYIERDKESIACCSSLLFISLKVPGKILHITANEDSPTPFSGAKVEEVFVTAGEEDELNAPTIGVYYNHTLMIGTILHNLMICEVPFLIYEWSGHLCSAVPCMLFSNMSTSMPDTDAQQIWSVDC